MTGVRLICSSLAGIPPPEKHRPSGQREQNLKPLLKTPRRNTIFLTILSLIKPPPPSNAFTLGISGPKEWLKEQKKKASNFLLAPIDASRKSLRTAFLLLSGSESESAGDELGEVQRLVRSAARDCVVQERNSFVAFQARTGVEVCTFSLIVKNAASLLGDKDPVKLETEAMLGDLIRSFTFLNGVTENNNLQLASNR
ncbi:plasma membrane fusion protein isoform X2 [Tasmannia lanceolata]